VIVDPDFLDHWKTRLLVNLLADEIAPVYVIRLWAHCQMRHQSTFDGLTPEALKALCRFPGHANKLESSLVASGFVRREGTLLNVTNWDTYNASLIAAWGNGSKGGRPKGSKNPTVTNGKPTGNPRVSEKRRGEKKKPPLSPKGEGVVFPQELDSDRFRDAWFQWERHRKELKVKAYTPTGVARQFKKLAELGEDRAVAAIDFSIRQNYQGVYEPKEANEQATKEPFRQKIMTEEEAADWRMGS